MRIESTAAWLAAASLGQMAVGEVIPQNSVIQFLNGPDGFTSDDNSITTLTKGAVFTSTVTNGRARPKYFLFNSTGVGVSEVVLYANGQEIGRAAVTNSSSSSPLPGEDSVPASGGTTTSAQGPPLPTGVDSTTNAVGNPASSTIPINSLESQHTKHHNGKRNRRRQGTGMGSGGSGTGTGTGSSQFVAFNLTMKTGPTGPIGNISFPDLLQILTQGHKGQELYFQAIWTEAGGSSYSRPFTVIDSAPNSQEFIDLEQSDMYADNKAVPFKPEVNPSAVTIVSSSVFPTATTTPDIAGGGSTAASGVASSSGLSTGAIAGIAVGAGLAGVIFFGLGLFFCMRRRRGHSASEKPYGGSNRTQELIGEKEANGGADLSPHSPYSDDGHQAALRDHMDDLDDRSHGSAVPMTSTGAAGAATIVSPSAAPLHDGTSRSYTPYSDHPSHRAGVTSSRQSGHLDDSATHSSYTAAGGSPRAATATPQGVSAQYAHLIEDDMTAEQIAALEEEERQLDAAIERAGGGATTGRRR